MGTNYYLHQNVCKCCGRGDTPIHIGKSSAGWCFSLHVDATNDPPLNDLNDWQDFWKTGQIRDEYGTDLTAEEMLQIITKRFWGRGIIDRNKLLDDNHAELGPNGLLRSRIDGSYCTGHGAGTWDLKVGEFF